MPRISETVKADHALITELYHAIRSAEPEDRHQLRNQFIWTLDRYLRVEDLVVTPAIEKHLTKHGHQRRQRLSDDFESVSPGPPSTTSSSKYLAGDTNHHLCRYR